MLKKIVIVGGGSAGWLTAGIIASEHVTGSERGIELVLIESPDVPTIGVGEGTWPSMRNTLKKIGLSETDFVRDCEVSFKQGSKFIGWREGASADDVYYHPFTLPEGFEQINMANQWVATQSSMPFADFVSPQPAVAERHLAPKQIATPEYAGVLNYGYHLNAGKFTEVLKKHCVEQLGVRHIVDHVLEVVRAENGDISHLRTEVNADIDADLFIDCTGFASLLLGKTLGVNFTEKKAFLFNDSALVTQPSHAHEQSDIASCTMATAVDCGWIWDIGLPTRRGVGHVFSSDHSDIDLVEKNMRAYLSQTLSQTQIEQLNFRTLKFNPGHREIFWKNNCVAVGIAAGFIEPLEATALVLIELSAGMISDQLPADRKSMDIIARRFNKTFLHHWERIIEFLKLHYVLSQREDSDYWCDHHREDTLPESLRELLLLWQHKVPWKDDVPLSEMFPWASYQYVLYGMGFVTALPPVKRRNEQAESALGERVLAEKIKKLGLYQERLQTNRQLLNSLRDQRFHRIQL